MSAAVMLLWWLDIPVGAENGGEPPVLFTAELWQRVHWIPNKSQDDILFVSPLTPPARFT